MLAFIAEYSFMIIISTFSKANDLTSSRKFTENVHSFPSKKTIILRVLLGTIITKSYAGLI